ncbi:MAG TPA: enoyl-CoA hydratase/isomerase family protein [Pyrinomonadaceae bacterium]|jgi:enoyl-CoA hydratase
MTAEANDSRPPSLIVEEHPPSVAVIRINRAAERNSLSISTLRQLDAALSALIPRTDISSIILTGTGDVFAAGADIRELRALTPETAGEFAALGQHLFQKIAEARQLTIAAINGYCMGGGLDLALSCDLRFASSGAVFAHPGARLGIITGWGGTQRLPGLIGAARALEMFTTARRLTSAEAYSIGLVSRIADPVLDYALEFAGQR